MNNIGMRPTRDPEGRELDRGTKNRVSQVAEVFEQGQENGTEQRGSNSAAARLASFKFYATI